MRPGEPKVGLGRLISGAKMRVGLPKSPKRAPDKMHISTGADFILPKLRKTLKTLVKITYFAISEKVALGA